ncbi:hypothetical protein Dtox_4007 [Desulfofarcimen acetoxidans DSM 771]|uniref:Uncharacterized protein n=1 Tax=Desulfofarcimen acetoxidans (strain ATCC 49208 / DSM 771 / KCTC 5769 / VKM B-1644 / 5575) TaxID=485916 RepID=C8VY66_DESAS|nr:hypothetical protein [Desulfofarcimen acetoxidans]ACV64695.1 hypothetical protein Dtox_4007 [Desulfofarcimen acetoxidans DSM 771]
MQKDYAATCGYHSGELMNRLTEDITMVSEGITGIVTKVCGVIDKAAVCCGVLNACFSSAGT